MSKMIPILTVACAMSVAMMVNEHLYRAESSEPKAQTSALAPLHPCEQVLTTNVMTWSCKQLMIQRWCVDGAPCLIHMGAAI